MAERGAYLAACKRLGVEPEPPPAVPEVRLRWPMRMLYRLVGIR